MHVVVTGGTGLVGRLLTRTLASAGHEVTILSRSGNRPAGLPEGVEVCRWDARTASGWEETAERADAIVNLAGENLSSGPWTDARKRRIVRSRVDSGAAVVQAVERASRKPRVLIQASAVGYYGPRRDEEITEEAPAGSDFLARVCVDWEASTAPVEAMGVRRAVVRTGMLLSIRGGALPLLALPVRMFVGGRLGSGKQWVPWIHISDEVAAIQFLLENEAAQGPFNLAAPQPVTNARLVRAIGRVLGRPTLFWAPSLALKLVLGEMSTVVLGSQRVVPRRLTEAGFRFKFPEIDQALWDLYGG